MQQQQLSDATLILYAIPFMLAVAVVLGITAYAAFSYWHTELRVRWHKARLERLMRKLHCAQEHLLDSWNLDAMRRAHAYKTMTLIYLPEQYQAINILQDAAMRIWLEDPIIAESIHREAEETVDA